MDDARGHFMGAEDRPNLGEDAAKPTGLSAGPSGPPRQTGGLADTTAEPAAGGDAKDSAVALRQSQQRLALHFQNTPLGIIEWDLEFRVVSWNPAAERIFGYSFHEALGRHPYELIVPATAQAHVTVVWGELLQQRGGRRSRNENFTKDGRTILCEWYNTPILAESSQVTGVLSLVQDVTEQVGVEEERDRLFNLSIDLLCVVGFDGYFKQVNPAWPSTLGWSEQELLSRPWLDFVHPEDREASRQANEELSAGQPVYGLECRFRCRDDSWRWLSWNAFPLRATKRIFAVVRDVTAGKQAEQFLRESEQRFRLLAEASFEGIGMVENGIVVDANHQLARLFGYDREELIGRPVLDLVAPESRAEVAQAIQTGRADVYEHLALRRDGTVFPVQVRGHETRVGKRHLRLTVISDITDRKRAEQEHLRRLQRLWDQQSAIVRLATHESLLSGDFVTAAKYCCEVAAAALQVEQVGVWLLSEDGSELRCVNEHRRSLRSHSSGLVLRRDEHPAYFQAMRTDRTIAADDALTDPRTCEFRDDYLVPFHISSLLDAPVRVSGRLAGVVCHEQIGQPRRWSDDEVQFAAQVADQVAQALVSRDRQQVQAQLQESEALYHSLVENLPQNVFRKDLQGRFTFVNRRFCETVGKPASEILGKTDFDLFERRLAEKYQGDDRRVVETGQPFETVEEHGRPGGQRLQVQVSKTALCDPHGKIVGVQGIFWDITEQRLAVMALRESEANLAAAQRLARLGSWTLDFINTDDPNQARLAWSDEVFRIFGYAPGQVKPSRYSFYQAVHPDDRQRVLRAANEALSGRGAYNLEHRIVLPDGSVRAVHEQAEVVFNPATGRPVRMLGTVQDVTGRRQLEDELRQAQKMEIIGQLADGVAHDFNNLLMVIQGNAHLAAVNPGLTGESQELLRQITQAAQSAAELTRQLLAFSHRQQIHLRPVDLAKLVADVAKLLRRMIGEHLELKCQFPNAPLLVQADVGMMEQLLMNLVVNARDAMQQQGQVRLAVELRSVEAAQAKRNPRARAGQFVCLSVSDTGCGIAPEHLERIFDPFFTTKPAGKGTGLGLATVLRVVEQHQGWIEVQSQVGKGTTFEVHFPPAAHLEAMVNASAPKTELRGGHEAILVVEDEAAVRALIRKSLERYGYRVWEAASGPQALSVWRQHHAVFDLLICDVILPGGMSGFQLAERLRGEKPALKVIYSSGYGGDILGEGPAAGKDISFLPKPYLPRRLAELVRDCLDRQ
jgi:PAS domain S-box-containing protein